MKKCTLGMVAYNFGLRRKQQLEQNSRTDLFAPLNLLQHCHAIGAGGMQTSLGLLDADQVRELRDYAEKFELFIDGIVAAPKSDSDLPRFEAEIRSAAAVGALAVRTVVIPGRRYENFSSLKEFREAQERARKALELARPIVEKHRVRLAVENHKDERLDERLALYKHLNSDWIGACVDTGNSVALLDDPYVVVESLAPLAFTVHLKDQAVREYDAGFLLGDIPLGRGCFDLRRMVNTLRKANPRVPIHLELITRDPLHVPCLTEKYWSVYGDIPARDVARTLRLAREHAADSFEKVSLLSTREQASLEEAYIAQSLEYARTKLGF